MTCTKVTGKMISKMAKVPIFIRTVQSIRAIGLTIRKKEKELSTGQMVLFTKVPIGTVRRTVSVGLNGLMEQFMKETL